MVTPPNNVSKSYYLIEFFFLLKVCQARLDNFVTNIFNKIVNIHNFIIIIIILGIISII